MKHVLVSVLVLALAACGGESTEAADVAPVPAAPAILAADILSPEGFGGARIGMSRAEVVAVLGDKADPNAVVGPDEASCAEFHPANAPEGLYAMFVDGKLSRITVTELSPVKDSAGFGVGASPDAVKRHYGARAQTSPHKYQDAPAEYITVWEGGPRAEPYVEDPAARGLVYEIDGTGKVGAIHAGDPSIQYVEGCA